MRLRSAETQVAVLETIAGKCETKMCEQKASYSVLMSVYYKEKALHLKTAIDSIFSQTCLTDDFVLVCDGPLNEALYAVIEDVQQMHGDVFHVVQLEQNVGLGRALNIGMQHCKNEIIARMDSDDYALPQRCEKQLAVMKAENVDIVSANIQEYDAEMAIPGVIRKVPESHEAIAKFAKMRNPFNHPCVMYRRSAVEAAGRYQDFYLLEDYSLWIRMLMNGSKGRNIQEVLLKMRAGSDLYMRRSGFRYACSACRLVCNMKRNGFIGWGRMISNLSVRFVVAMLPNWCRKLVYRFTLREVK